MKKIVIFLLIWIMSVMVHADIYTLKLDSPTVLENAGSATLVFQIDPALPNGTNIDLTWATAPITGSATSGSDYTSSSGTITNMTGGNVYSISIPIINDTVSGEGNEQFRVNITSATINKDVVVRDNTGGLVTIIDDETASLPSLSISNVTVDEGAGTATFTVNLSSIATQNVQFNYTTSDGNATVGSDYTLTSGTGTIFTGQNTKTISVPIINDLMAGEGNEIFYLTLSNPINAQVAVSTAIGTITDNDTGLTLGINDAAIAESNSDINAIVKLVLSEPAPAGGVAVTYHTVNGSAIAPGDYTAIASGTVTIPEGSKTYDLILTIKGDTTIEGIEEFNVNIDSAVASSSVVIADNISKVTIFDDDSVTGGCSSYIGLISINEYQNNPHYFDDYNNKITGNYVEIKYIDFLVKQYINNLWSVSIYTTAGTQTLTWDQRDNLCADPRYAVFQMSNNVMGAQGYVVLKDANGNEVDVLNIDDSDHYAQQCENFAYDTTFGSSAQNKDIFRNPDGTGDWYDTGAGANSTGSRCTGLNGGGQDGLIFTQFDAVDTDVTIPDPVTTPSMILKTRIVSKLSDIKIISIDVNNSIPNNPLVPITSTIKASIVDGNSLATVFPTTYNVAFNAATSVTLPNVSFTKAHKNVRVKFEYCENASGVLQPTYVGCALPLKVSYSRDTFAIRPNMFDSNMSTSGNWKAFSNKNITLLAKDFNGVAALDYNETEGSSFRADVNVSDATKICAEPQLYFQNPINFSDGNASGNRYLRNVGDFNVSIYEISGSEFAHVDLDDTPDNVRYITPYNAAIKIIPDHFWIDFMTFKNGSNGFSYLSNFESYPNSADRNVSGYVDLNITAKGAAPSGGILSNYTSTCYAKNGNIQMNLANALSAGTLTKLLWYDQKHDLNGSRPLGGTSYLMDMNASQFNSTDTNGSAQVRYLINFDRNQTQLISPFTLTPTSFDVNDTDGVYGTQNSTGNAYYVYGRIFPRDMRVFGANPFVANGWYEVFETSAIGTTPLLVSKNDSLWSTNTLHNDLNDGDSRVTRLVSSSGASTVNYSGNAVSGVEAFAFTTAITPTYNGKAHVNTAPWLWYAPNALMYSNPSTTNPANASGNEAACMTHPCFNVTVMPAIGATGSAKQDLSGDKSSKTSGSTGTWKSHSDYAPAIK